MKVQKEREALIHFKLTLFDWFHHKTILKQFI